MKGRLILSFLFIISGSESDGQTIFQTTLSASPDSFLLAESFRNTNDKGYIVLGCYGGVSDQIYLLKTDSLGMPLWHQYLGISSQTIGLCIQQCYDGGFIIGGYTDHLGWRKSYLLKTDSLGNISWSKAFGGANPGYDVCNYLEQTTDSGFVLIGTTSSFISGQDYMYVIKTNSVGNTNWTKLYRRINFSSGVRIHQTYDGGFIILGVTQNPAGESGVLIIKTDINGNKIWSKLIKTTYNEYYLDINLTFDRGYIVTCAFPDSVSNVNRNTYVKMNQNGDVSWVKSLGNGHGGDFRSVIQTSDSGFVLVGETYALGPAYNTSAFVIKTDSIGDTLWTRAYGNPNSLDTTFKRAIQVIETEDHGFSMLGQLDSSAYTTIGEKTCIIKTDEVGNSGCDDFSFTDSIFSTSIQERSHIIFVDSVNAIEYNLSSQVWPGGNVAAVDCGSVAISDYLNVKFALHLFPNPVSTNLSIVIEESAINSIMIFNLLGEIVLAVSLPTAYCLLPTEINVSSLPPGLYFLQATTDEGIATAKFVKADR